MTSSVEQVFEDTNFPSASKLRRVLTARGIPFDASEVDRLVQRETTRQVQAPRYKFNGKIAASRLHSRWFADIIDFSAAPSAMAGEDVGLRPTQSGESISWWSKTSSPERSGPRHSSTSGQLPWLQHLRKS